jgi:hypothetical protein
MRDMMIKMLAREEEEVMNKQTVSVSCRWLPQVVPLAATFEDTVALIQAESSSVVLIEDALLILTAVNTSVHDIIPSCRYLYCRKELFSIMACQQGGGQPWTASTSGCRILLVSEKKIALIFIAYSVS